jgi:hypothetical protein
MRALAKIAASTISNAVVFISIVFIEIGCAGKTEAPERISPR